MEGRRFVGAEREEEAFQAGLGWLSSGFSETALHSPPRTEEHPSIATLITETLGATIITTAPVSFLLTQKPHSC